MENLGRGVIALAQSDGKVFVSWRLLGTDADGVAFNLYRATDGGEPVKLNAEPLRDATCFADADAPTDKANAWFVRAVENAVEGKDSERFSRKADAPRVPYLSVPLQTPPGYTPNDASVGDLDGDGEYEILLHQAARGRDNSQAGQTEPPILEAYKLDGTLLGESILAATSARARTTRSSWSMISTAMDARRSRARRRTGRSTAWGK